MCGVGFSGKSALSKKIAEYTGATLISQDGIYFEMEKETGISQDSDNDWEIVLGVSKERIVENLKKGNSVVFDNVNIRIEDRDVLRQLASSAEAVSKVIYLDTPLHIQKERQLKNIETKERHDVKQEYLDESIRELDVPTANEDILIFYPDTDLDLFLKQL